MHGLSHRARLSTIFRVSPTTFRGLSTIFRVRWFEVWLFKYKESGF